MVAEDSCPCCGAEMEECDLCADEMTEGQMADYMAGLWRAFFCPQCGFTDMYEGHFTSDCEDDLSDRRWWKPHILGGETEKEEVLRQFGMLEKYRQFEWEAWQIELKARGKESREAPEPWEYLSLRERAKKTWGVLRKNLNKLRGNDREVALKVLRRLTDWGHKEAARLYPHPKPCEVCGTKKDTARHHRDGNPLNNKPSNIGYLCRKHHGMLKYAYPDWWARYHESKRGD